MLQHFSWLVLKARVRSLLKELVQALADSTPTPSVTHEQPCFGTRRSVGVGGGFLLASASLPFGSPLCLGAVGALMLPSMLHSALNLLRILSIE